MKIDLCGFINGNVYMYIWRVDIRNNIIDVELKVENVLNVIKYEGWYFKIWKVLN